MARIQRQQITAIPATGFVSVLTPASGKKDELLTLAIAAYGGTGLKFRPALNLGGFELYLDEIPLATGVAGVCVSYTSIVVLAGQKLDIAQVGVGTCFVTATYMDVDV